MESALEVTKNYYQSTRISNSLLKSVQNPRLLKLKKDRPELFENEDSTAFRIGSAVDCLLTSPKEWEERFRVLEVNKPYGLMGTFVQNLPPGLHRDSEQFKYEKAYWQSGYKMSISWVIDRFWNTKEAVEYYLSVKNCPENITLLAKDEYDSVTKAVELIIASPYAYSYFFKNSTWEELYHQVPIYFSYKNEEFKALLDGIKVNHKLSLIEPFDLKTTGKSVYEFKDSFIKYGYYTQAALYDYAIRQPESPVFDLINEGYKIADFRFIVTETKVSSQNPALIFRTTERDRFVGINGGYYGNTYHKGVDQLLEDYKWHVENDEWIYPREVYENKGEVLLNVFNNTP